MFPEEALEMINAAVEAISPEALETAAAKLQEIAAKDSTDDLSVVVHSEEEVLTQVIY